VAQLYKSGGGVFANPYLLLAFTTLFWGGNAVAGKLAVGDLSFIALTFWRWSVACVVLLPIAWPHVVRDWSLICRHRWLLLGLGAIGFTGFNLNMYWALQYTSVVNVVIEQAAIPILIMLFNFMLFRLQVRLLQVVGLVLALLGVVLTVTSGQPLSILDSGVNRGDAIMMLAGLCYAVYSVGLRWRPAMHWLSFLFVLSVSAWLVSFALWMTESVQIGFSVPTGKAIGLVIYVGIFPSLLSQLFYARGVDLIGANRASLFINLVPVFGSLLAVLLLGEHFRWFHAVGLVLVAGGIYLAEMAARAKTSATH
jgi:drug/metabolite transporter (DMT)-like permease